MLNALVEFCGCFWYIVGFVLLVYIIEKAVDRAERLKERERRIKKKKVYVMAKMVDDYVRLDRKLRKN